MKLKTPYKVKETRDEINQIRKLLLRAAHDYSVSLNYSNVTDRWLCVLSSYQRVYGNTYECRGNAGVGENAEMSKAIKIAWNKANGKM